MKLLVCGSRDFKDKRGVFSNILSAVHLDTPITLLIEGGARGADQYAFWWARRHHILHRQFKADWRLYGRGAGPIRNRQMLEEGKPDQVLAFLSKPLSESTGTANMVKLARAANIPVTIHEDFP